MHGRQGEQVRVGEEEQGDVGQEGEDMGERGPGEEGGEVGGGEGAGGGGEEERGHD